MRTVSLSLFFLLLAVGVSAQTAAELFIVSPDALLPQVERNKKKEMVLMFEAGRKDGIENRWGGKARILQMDSVYLEAQLSPVSTVQLLVLPGIDSLKQVWMIFTVEAPAKESRVALYTSRWEAEASAFKAATLSDFTQPGVRTQQTATIDLFPIEYRFDPQGQRILARHSLQDYLPEELYREIVPFLISDTLSVPLPAGGKWKLK